MYFCEKFDFTADIIKKTITFNTMNATNIAIFASGKGSNADRLMQYFATKEEMGIRLVLTNKPDAGVIDFATKHNIPVAICSNSAIENGDEVLEILSKHNIDLIVLAGFLRKIPAKLITSFPDKIINIHPSLLPKHGGKGMYGDFVHQAVLNATDKKTGITIHTVDERYDHGKRLAQYEVALTNDETIDSIRAKVQSLEHSYFASTIENYIKELTKTKKPLC